MFASRFGRGRAALTALILAVSVPIEAVRAAKTGAAQTKLSDDEIRQAVLRELSHAAGVGPHSLSVTVNAGVAKLSGHADHLLERERAILAALGVRGVRSVIDNVGLRLVVRNNHDIAVDVVGAMDGDVVVESYQVKAQVNQGVVTLSGRVDSNRERLQAIRLAKTIRGVRDVVDDITVAVPEHRTDAALRADIKNALHWDRLLDDDQIRVDVTAGTVTLPGSVGSGLEKIRAEHLAYVPRIKHVRNELFVVPGRRQPATPKERANIPDATVAAAVQATVQRDPRTDDFDLGVASSGHIVTLTGAVDSVATKRAAAQDARNTVGVLGVVDHMTVAPAPRTDADIASAVRAAVHRDVWVGENEVSVKVASGVVELHGTVDSKFERGHADMLAAAVRGARRIDNHLRVASDATPHWEPRIDEWDPSRYPWFERSKGPTASDKEIAAAIRNELRWSPFVDEADINVTVRDGTALLEGTVDSPAERAAATENALEGGATSVVNHLRSRVDT